MRSMFSRRPSPSALIAVIAVVLAASGTAVAGSLVTGAQVEDGSLTGADVRDGSLGRADLAPSAREAARRGRRGPRGPRGPRGFTGPQGPPGLQGHPGPAGIATVTSADGPAAAQCADGGGGCQVASSVATCPAGMFAVGGGFDADTPDNVVAYARRGVSSYGVIATNFWSTSATVRAQVVCASGPGVSASRVASNRALRSALDRRAGALRAKLR